MSNESGRTIGLVAVAAASFLVARAVASAVARPRYSFSGKTVLITGGARGLGLAMARRFADEGAHVVLVSRSADELARAAAELRARGAHVTVHVADLRDAQRAAGVVGEVVGTTGRLDVLVNNAGVIQVTPFEHATTADFQDSLDIHFWAPLHLIRAALPHLEEQRGRIVNISSIGGRTGVPHLLPYSAGKFALTGLSEGLHAELSRRGVHVLTVTPGLMRTGSHRNALVRGRHQAEARWFGVAAGMPLISMQVERAAREIVDALAAGRARVTPNVVARAAEVADALTPELVATASRLATRLLPTPDDRPEAARLRRSRDIDLGWVARLMPTDAARRMNQPVAADEEAPVRPGTERTPESAHHDRFPTAEVT
jgi:NAD(P)-dependent dehydrogenase (short-subunit alcohol dehydrogenase family)